MVYIRKKLTIFIKVLNIPVGCHNSSFMQFSKSYFKALNRKANWLNPIL